MMEKNLSSKSTKEEVADYFVENFKCKEETRELIIKEDISGDVLPYLQNEDFQSLKLNTARSKRIKEYLKDNKNNFEEKEIKEKITMDSSEEKVKLFLERYINFKSSNNDINLNGKSLLELDEEQMKSKGMNIGQRRKLEKYIKDFKASKIDEPKIEYKLITEASNEEEVADYLRIELKLSEESLEELESTNGKLLFSFKESEINEMPIIEEDKETLKNFLKKNTKNKEQINQPIKQPKKQPIKEPKKEPNERLVHRPSLKIKNTLTSMNIDSAQKKDSNEISNESNKKSEKKNFFFMHEKNRIEKISKQLKYGIFFIMTVKKNQMKNMKFSTYEEIIERKKKFYNNFTYRFINEKDIISTENEAIKIFIVQVSMEQKIKKLSFTLKYYKDADRKKEEEYEGNFDLIFHESKEKEDKKKLIDKKNFYYFNINNLKYNNHNEELLEINEIYNEYLNFFLNNKQNIDSERNKDLIMILRNYIKNSKINIELSAETILYLLKLSLEYKVRFENFGKIKLKQTKGKDEFKYNYDLSNLNMEKLLGIVKKEKSNFVNLIIKIYLVSDINKLIELIKSDKAEEYCMALISLIDKNNINIETLIINDENERIFFQKQLLDKLDKSYKEKKAKKILEIILKLSRGLTNCLYFVVQNFEKIYNILKKEAPIGIISREKTLISHYLINIENRCFEEDLNKIYVLLSKLKHYYSIEKKYKYKIIDINKIFEILLNNYSNKSLEDLCKLRNILQLTLKENTDYYKIEKDLNDNIHNKGLNLIINKKITPDKIIMFITEQDAYYFQKEINDIKKKDPEILRNIPITNIDENYLKNIEVMKDKKLWKLIVESKEEIRNKFYEILLEQIKKVTDLKSIFDIFPIKEINKSFMILINKKIDEIKYKILDQKEVDESILFEIYDNLLIINNNYKIDLASLFEIFEVNYVITPKYYFHLIKSKKMRNITYKIYDNITQFFIEQNAKGADNAESIISLLIIAEENKLDNLREAILEQLNSKIITEEDFYQKEESQNFQIFKLFFEKCNNLLLTWKGKYLDESNKIREKIKKDLINCNVEYDLINNLIDKTDSFFNRIKVIFFDLKESEKIFFNLKQNLNICKNKFKELETIHDFYNTFYNNTKEEIISSIVEKLKELRKKNISELIKIERFGKDLNQLNLDEALKESQKIKYKNQYFFKAIYNKKYTNEINEKTEDIIFNESIKTYRDSLTKIITKQPFYTIDYIEEIINVIKNSNIDLQREIDFILEEFKELGKENYIKNNLLNNLKTFSKKDKIIAILKGINTFIESFNEIRKIKFELIEDLKQNIDRLTSKEVNEEDINNSINFLKKYNKTDIEEEIAINKFYESLANKKEPILFIKEIREKNFEIRNLNEFIDESASELQISDIDNLSFVYELFQSLIINLSNIRTDKELIDIFRKKFNADKEIGLKLQNFLNAFGEIKQLFDYYNENPEMATNKIQNILNNSNIEIYKVEKLHHFIFKIIFKDDEQKKEKKVKKINNILDINALDELRNKILISSTNNSSQKEEQKNNIKKKNTLDKTQLINEFVSLIDNIKELTKTLNSLLKSGFPNLENINLTINNSNATDKNNKNLEKIIEEYKEKNKKFKNVVKDGYKKFPLLRLFYGMQFIQLYEKIKNNEKDISHLINSVSLNKLKNLNINYAYQIHKNELENIHDYIYNLFSANNIKLNDLLLENDVIKEINLIPGLYRKPKARDDDNNYLINNVLNIYLNMTNNLPTINTLLICNEETSIERIKAFLNMAIYYNNHTLFLITNIEYLNLSTTRKMIRTLNKLYSDKKKEIESYILFFYKKDGSGLDRELEKLIPEKNILSDDFMK